MKFILDSLLSIIGKFAGALLGLFTGIILARTLGPEKLGQYQIFLSTQTIIITLFSLGIGNASIYFIGSKIVSKEEIVSSFIKIFIPLSILVSFFYGTAVLLFDNYFGYISKTVLLIFVIGTGSLVISSILRPLLYVKGEVKKLMYNNVLPSFVLFIGVFIGFYVLNILTVEIALFLWGIGNFLSCLFLIKYFKSEINFRIKINRSNLKKVMIYGVKLSASNLIFVFIGNISIFMMKIIMTDGFTAVGLYSRAIAISSLIYMIPNSIGPLLFTRWTGLDEESLKKQVSQSARVLVFITFILTVFVVLAREYIVNVLYGIEFQQISSVVFILAPMLIFQTISEVFNNLLASIGKAGATMYIMLFTLLIIIMFNFIFIPIYGINGAALSVLLGAIFNSIALFIFSRRRIEVHLKKILLIEKEDFTVGLNLIKKYF